MRKEVFEWERRDLRERRDLSEKGAIRVRKERFEWERRF